jgi:hypothetical protein
MKSLIFLFFAIAAAISSKSQTVNYPTDSLKKILCKTWEMKYAEMDGMRIGAKQGVNMLVLTFRNDNKVVVTGTDTDEKPEQQDWTYNIKGKYVSILKNKKEHLRIISLVEDDMVIKVTDTQNAPADLGDTKFILKPKQ